MFVSWFALQEEQERRSGIKEPSHSDSDSSSGSKKYVKTTVAQLLRLEDFLNDQIAMIHVVIVMVMMPVSLLLMMMLMMWMGIVDEDDDDDDE